MSLRVVALSSASNRSEPENGTRRHDSKPRHGREATRPTALPSGVRKASLILIASLLGLAGCKVGGPSVADQYRIEARDLRAKLEQANADNAELKTKLATLAAERSTPISPDAAQAMPALAKLEIGSYSGLAKDKTPDGKPFVRLYIQSSDARGRVIQITGTLRAKVTSADGKNLLGEASLAPLALRDAYRAGFMGVYYTIDVPVASDDAAPRIYHVEFQDAISGQTFSVQASDPASAR